MEQIVQYSTHHHTVGYLTAPQYLIRTSRLPTVYLLQRTQNHCSGMTYEVHHCKWLCLLTGLVSTPAGSVTSVAKSSSSTFTQAKSATAAAVAAAIASACGGDAQAAAQALAVAVANASAKAFAESSATVTVQGETVSRSTATCC